MSQVQQGYVGPVSRAFRRELVASPLVAAEIAPLLERGLREARRDGTRFSEDTLDYIVGALEARDFVRQRLRAQPDAGRPELRALKVDPVNEIDTTEAAKRLGTSRSNVTARLNRETLPGRRDERGRWWVNADALENA